MSEQPVHNIQEIAYSGGQVTYGFVVQREKPHHFHTQFTKLNQPGQAAVRNMDLWQCRFGNVDSPSGQQDQREGAASSAGGAAAAAGRGTAASAETWHKPITDTSPEVVQYLRAAVQKFLTSQRSAALEFDIPPGDNMRRNIITQMTQQLSSSDKNYATTQSSDGQRVYLAPQQYLTQLQEYIDQSK